MVDVCNRCNKRRMKNIAQSLDSIECSSYQLSHSHRISHWCIFNVISVWDGERNIEISLIFILDIDHFCVFNFFLHSMPMVIGTEEQGNVCLQKQVHGLIFDCTHHTSYQCRSSQPEHLRFLSIQIVKIFWLDLSSFLCALF